jgi:hypothetical protein
MQSEPKGEGMQSEPKGEGMQSEPKGFLCELFTTDNYADETSFQLIGPSGGIIGRAPLNGQKFQDNTQYTFQYCVK